MVRGQAQTLFLKYPDQRFIQQFISIGLIITKATNDFAFRVDEYARRYKIYRVFIADIVWRMVRTAVLWLIRDRDKAIYEK
jgi:hypothetical protein